MNPTRIGAKENDLPERDMLHHELIGPLHVVQRPTRMLFAQVLYKDLRIQAIKMINAVCETKKTNPGLFRIYEKEACPKKKKKEKEKMQTSSHI